jgi:hypothetical protein
MNPTEKRALLELSFERDGDGYLFYSNRWARGVPVTAQEREAYLAAPTLAANRAFHRSLRGRSATAPARKPGQVQKRTFASLPLRWGLTAALLGSILLLCGIGPELSAPRVALMIGGLGMAAFGVRIIAARLGARGR